jgi:NADH dehydrogenase
LPELAARGGHVLVVGAGLTGLEAATEIAEAYPRLRVELVSSKALEDDLSLRGAAYLRDTFRRQGIALRERTRINRLEANRALTIDGSVLPFDACVWTTGFAVSSLPKQSGLRVNNIGQIVIDGRLRSVSHPDIYAVGDAAAFAPETGLSLRMAALTALTMGFHAADNLSSWLHEKAESPFAFGFQARCISLGRRRALLQFVEPDDTPQSRIITGKAAAVFKEMTALYAFAAIRLQARGINIFWWSRALKAQPTQELQTAVVRG